MRIAFRNIESQLGRRENPPSHKGQRHRGLVYTQPISFIGLPVVAVPVPTAFGLPVGVQIITAPWREDVGLRIARALEAADVARTLQPKLDG
jgi:Asp-tRNA(Asn)/Glu-tRNA(Gln) amidotransferase A subunit family amidase